jgi:hypothetical protein
MARSLFGSSSADADTPFGIGSSNAVISIVSGSSIFAFSLFAGKFTKPDLHKLPDKLTNEIPISTVELFIGFSKLFHRGDAPILIIELSGCADDFLALSACCQFLDNFAQKMFVIAFGRFKLDASGRLTSRIYFSP